MWQTAPEPLGCLSGHIPILSEPLTLKTPEPNPKFLGLMQKRVTVGIFWGHIPKEEPGAEGHSDSSALKVLKRKSH